MSIGHTSTDSSGLVMAMMLTVAFWIIGAVYGSAFVYYIATGNSPAWASRIGIEFGEERPTTSSIDWDAFESEIDRAINKSVGKWEEEK